MILPALKLTITIYVIFSYIPGDPEKYSLKHFWVGSVLT